MKQYAVIVAGGSGSRMGGGIPKQFRSLKGRPMLWWSLKAFHDENPSTELILVLPEDFISLWNDYFLTLSDGERYPHKIAVGGESRSGSVRNGLALIDDKDSLVAVHDGARPMVRSATISEGWKAAEIHDAAIPVVKVVDSLRMITDSGSKSVDRSQFLAVQTPQVFKTDVLIKAYDFADGKTFSDDAAVVENYGCPVALFPGSEDNIKVTNPKDLAVASVLLD
ncbi:MAG: 2-C-methyl-D-erythritol 4-phosphate cytidylyltransferase [Muribaculaceae bacterium]|nr:2-C-methyl-D-erythritol 4-phosphate cytidylyltransferase [Muribaculaceae bacterium]